VRQLFLAIFERLAADIDRHVVDAADAGAGVVDDIGHRGGGDPRAANTSVAASRMRCCVASVFAQRRVSGVGKLLARGAVNRVIRGSRGRHATKLSRQNSTARSRSKLTRGRISMQCGPIGAP
jgi:hypothetical protein